MLLRVPLGSKLISTHASAPEPLRLTLEGFRSTMRRRCKVAKGRERKRAEPQPTRSSERAVRHVHDCNIAGMTVSSEADVNVKRPSWAAPMDKHRSCLPSEEIARVKGAVYSAVRNPIDPMLKLVKQGSDESQPA